MVSIKELVASRISMRLSSMLVDKFNLTIGQLARFYGIGYRVMSRKSSAIFDLPTRLRIPFV
jgi:trimethylamine:corrinoid methyltransferase-like protein